MFLKNKKLRGMSLVELLAYTVILSIVTTALFQLIHFIQDMNDKELKQQQIYSEFNLALIKLDTFVSKTSPMTPGEFLDIYNDNSCMQAAYKYPRDTGDLHKESFYFVKDDSSENYMLCNTKDLICDSQAPPPCKTNESDRLTTAIFKTDGRFFSELSQPHYKGVIYNFYIPKTDLEMKFTSFTKYQE